MWRRTLAGETWPGLAAALVAALALTTAAAAQQETPTPTTESPPPAAAKPCAGPEYRQFDFWVGDWEVTQPDGTPAGTNRIERILDGCVLQENWEGVDGSRGESYNLYSASDGHWHQTWVDKSGTLLLLDGGLEDGKMVLRGTRKGPGGRQLTDEISWELLDDGRVRQHWRVSPDGGESWRDLFIGLYARQP